MPTYTEKQFKSILNIRKFPDHWFWEKYGINPYNGCEHGCIYCDSRSAKYYLPTDFENDIIIKKNIKTMLESRLANASKLMPDITGMAGASDPYHTAEATYQNTRQCLEVLEKYKFPVHILSKSLLVMRDLDLLQQIAFNNWACVSMTITSANHEIAGFIEPKAPPPDARFEVIKKIKKNYSQIQSGVLLMPVIPYLSDAPFQLEELIRKAKDNGADFVLFSSGMTLRNIQAIWFLNHLKKSFPSLIPKYEALYQFKYNPQYYDGNYTVTNEYYRMINLILLELCNKYKMPVRIKRFIPDDFRKLNYHISEILLNKAYNQQLINFSEKKLFWTGVHIQQLKESIHNIYQRNELHTLPNLDRETEEIIKKEILKEYQPVEKIHQLKLFE